jgi:hypothetical protein
MYGLRSINNMYSEFAGTRSDFIVVGHPEFNGGKVGSSSGFGKGWVDEPIPCNPKTSPAIQNVKRKGGSAKILHRLRQVPDEPAPSIKSRALARAESAAAVDTSNSLDANDVRHNFDAFIAAIKAPESLPAFRPDLMRTTQGAGNHSVEGAGCRRHAAFQEELQDVIQRLRRDPVGTERDLLKTQAWKHYAFHLEMARRREHHFQRKGRASLPSIGKNIHGR